MHRYLHVRTSTCTCIMRMQVRAWYPRAYLVEPALYAGVHFMERHLEDITLRRRRVDVESRHFYRPPEV